MTDEGSSGVFDNVPSVSQEGSLYRKVPLDSDARLRVIEEMREIETVDDATMWDGLMEVAGKFREHNGIWNKQTVAVSIGDRERTVEDALVSVGGQANEMNIENPWEPLDPKTDQSMNQFGWYPIDDLQDKTIEGVYGRIKHKIAKEAIARSNPTISDRYIGYISTKGEFGVTIGVFDMDSKTQTELQFPPDK